MVPLFQSTKSTKMRTQSSKLSKRKRTQIQVAQRKKRRSKRTRLKSSIPLARLHMSLWASVFTVKKAKQAIEKMKMDISMVMAKIKINSCLYTTLELKRKTQQDWKDITRILIKMRLLITTVTLMKSIAKMKDGRRTSFLTNLFHLQSLKGTRAAWSCKIVQSGKWASIAVIVLQLATQMTANHTKMNTKLSPANAGITVFHANKLASPLSL